MKVIKGLLLFGFVVLGTSSCIDPPAFPITPEIENASVYFGVTPDPSELDSLVLSFDFRDGDGDLGLNANNTSNPYHISNFFFENKGQIEAVPTITGTTNESNPRIFSPILLPNADQDARLVTLETRDNPDYDYSFLPLNIFPYSCNNYVEKTLYIFEEDAARLLKPSYNYNIVDTITDITPILYKIQATFYTEYNPNRYNITVEFQTKEQNPDNTFTYVTFDWRERLCTTFDGRFPVLSDKSSPLEGTLHYSMKSSGFYNIFSTKTMRLKIQIQDKAFHKSNFTYTSDFTLDQIRKH